MDVKKTGVSTRLPWVQIAVTVVLLYGIANAADARRHPDSGANLPNRVMQVPLSSEYSERHVAVFDQVSK